MIQIGNYQFEGPYQYISDLKPDSGVYAVLCANSQKANNYIVQDIGEASDVNDRIKNHDRKTCWTRNCTTSLSVAVLYTPYLTPDQRRAIEHLLRITYNPPCGIH